MLNEDKKLKLLKKSTNFVFMKNYNYLLPIFFGCFLMCLISCSKDADPVTYYFRAQVEAGPVSLIDDNSDWGVGANGNSVESNISDAVVTGTEIEISLLLPSGFTAADMPALAGDSLSYDNNTRPSIFVRYFINGGTETETTNDIEQVNSHFYIESVEETDLPASYLESFPPARAFNVQGTMAFQTDLFTFTEGEFLLRWVVEE